MKRQPITKHRRLRKYGAPPAVEKEVEPTPVTAEPSAPPDTTPYAILQRMLGWNESNLPRATGKEFTLYSYKNRCITSQLSEPLKQLLADDLIEITEEQPNHYCCRVTPAGITKIEERFHIRVEDVQEQFRKKQEENLKKLNKKSATTRKVAPKSRTTSTKKSTNSETTRGRRGTKR